MLCGQQHIARAASADAVSSVRLAEAFSSGLDSTSASGRTADRGSPAGDETAPIVANLSAAPTAARSSSRSLAIRLTLTCSNRPRIAGLEQVNDRLEVETRSRHRHASRPRGTGTLRHRSTPKLMRCPSARRPADPATPRMPSVEPSGRAPAIAAPPPAHLHQPGYRCNICAEPSREERLQHPRFGVVAAAGGVGYDPPETAARQRRTHTFTCRASGSARGRHRKGAENGGRARERLSSRRHISGQAAATIRPATSRIATNHPSTNDQRPSGAWAPASAAAPSRCRSARRARRRGRCARRGNAP